MRTLGLTGSIGCGKSHVSSILQSLGARIIDGDRISHALTVPGGPALPAIRDVFSDAVFDEAGHLNRSMLGSLVFSDAAKRDQLNRIMQPLILAQIRQELQQALTDAVPVVVLDMPLLFEEGLDRLCDSVWCVSLPRPLQLRRIMERDGCTRETAEARIAAQLAPEEKSRRSDVVIDTSGTMEETARMIPALYARELALA